MTFTKNDKTITFLLHHTGILFGNKNEIFLQQ